MPIVDGKSLTADEAYNSGLCPECGVSLSKVHVEGHIHHHWPRGFDERDPKQDEGRRRMEMLKRHAGMLA